MASLRAYRNEIKGLAILWVVFFHMQLGLTGPVSALQQIGYGGVDIFFFLSGFGLYTSLQKTTRGYLARRARRLLPAYWPFCALWLLVMIPLNHLGLGQAVKTVLGNGLMLGYFFNAPLMINWYVSALAASVLLAPALFWLLTRRPRLWPVWLALCFAVALPFLGQNQMMAVSRLPVFLLGMVFAMKEKEPARGLMAGAALALAAGLTLLAACFRQWPDKLIAWGGYWYPFCLIAPALCLLTGRLFARFLPEGCAFLRRLGEGSFEIFLFNVWLEWLMKKQWQLQSPWLWLLAGLVSVAAGMAYHRAVLKMEKIFCQSQTKSR